MPAEPRLCAGYRPTQVRTRSHFVFDPVMLLIASAICWLVLRGRIRFAVLDTAPKNACNFKRTGAISFRHVASVPSARMAPACFCFFSREGRWLWSVQIPHPLERCLPVHRLHEEKFACKVTLCRSALHSIKCANHGTVLPADIASVCGSCAALETDKHVAKLVRNAALPTPKKKTNFYYFSQKQLTGHCEAKVTTIEQLQLKVFNEGKKVSRLQGRVKSYLALLMAISNFDVMQLCAVFRAAYKKFPTPHVLIHLLEKAASGKFKPRDFTIDQIHFAKLCYLLGKKCMLLLMHQW